MEHRLTEKNPQAGTLAQRKGESRPSRYLLEGSPIVSEGGTNSLVGRQTTADLRHEQEKELQDHLEQLRDVDAPLAVADGNMSRGGSSPHVDVPLAVADGNKSRGGSGPGDNLSDQDSRVTSKFWRKRPRSKDLGSLGLSSSEDNLPAPKVSTGRRGRGRAVGATARVPERDVRGRFLPRPDTPAPSECVQSDPGHMSADQSGGSTTSLLGANKAEANAAKRAQQRAVALDEVSELARQARERRSARTADASVVALSRQVTDSLDVVLKVATKSGNLKGTFTRALKDAVESIQEAVEVLSTRTTTEETAKLWEENSRLRSELEDLKRQFAAQTVASNITSPPLAPAPSSAPSPAPSSAPALADAEIEKIARICMMQCGQMVGARLEAIEARLPTETLRPPLAGDRRRQEGTAKPAVALRSNAGKGATKPTEGPSKPAEGRSAPTSKSVAATVPTPPGPLTEAWTTVVKRGRRRKKGTTPSIPAGAPTPASGKAVGPPKVRAPRSAAVVITLQPGAVERGVSYKAVFSEAKAKVAFPELGTPSGFRMRSAITGARLLEVSGVSSAEKADILAAKLREVLNPEDVRVYRPMKTAELHIDGLDDSTAPAEVVAAIAQAGGCPPEDVRTGEIRADTTGLGMIWVRCPVAAAKKVADAGRLLVGWVAARAKLLQPRALRCYRCLNIGHVRARCTAETDRSEQCYRCGQPGHKAAQCSAAPNCSLCTAAGRPAGHRAGGKACGAPAQQQKRRRRAKVAGGSLPPRQPGCSSADSGPRNGVEGMDCV